MVGYLLYVWKGMCVMSLQFSFDRKHAPLLPRVADLLHPSLYTAEDVQRLLEREQLLHDLWGGEPLPAPLDISAMRYVLDIGCGVGTWLYSMARHYPRLHLMGIDRNRNTIDAAQALNAANTRVHLQARDITGDALATCTIGGYDLVHLRFLIGEATPHQYAALIREGVRCCRPGGIIVLCEAELPLSASSALKHLMLLLQLTLEHENRAFAPRVPNQLGIVSWAQRTLRATNCTPVMEEMYYAQCAYGDAGYLHFCRHLEQAMRRIRPLLLRTRCITVSDLDNLESEVRREVASQKFYGLCPLHVLAWQRGPVQVH